MTALSVKAAAHPLFKRPFPSTWSKTLVFADQLTAGTSLTNAQIHFAATHFVGTQKILVPLIRKLRAINPRFLVLHYHLGVWQSGKNVPYIINGFHWGNDYSHVSRHESWFLHTAYANGKNPKDRLKAVDGKYLMNITNSAYFHYLVQSLIRQARAGHDDGIFLDSYSTAAVNYYMHNYSHWCYPRIVQAHKQLGGLTWAQASDNFMQRLTADLNKAGIYCLPNIGDLVTGWDHTDYALSNGGMLEGAPGQWSHYGQTQWVQSANRALQLIDADKIIFFQSYLHDAADYRQRLYWLGTYLLLRGRYTYITYFNRHPFEYYPEFGINIGTPLKTAKTIADLQKGALYIRRFTQGLVVVNSADRKSHAYRIPVGYREAQVQGGGTINASGKMSGALIFVPVGGRVRLPPHSSLILVRRHA